MTESTLIGMASILDMWEHFLESGHEKELLTAELVSHLIERLHSGELRSMEIDYAAMMSVRSPAILEDRDLAAQLALVIAEICFGYHLEASNAAYEKAWEDFDPKTDWYGNMSTSQSPCTAMHLQLFRNFPHRDLAVEAAEKVAKRPDLLDLERVVDPSDGLAREGGFWMEHSPDLAMRVAALADVEWGGRVL